MTTETATTTEMTVESQAADIVALKAQAAMDGDHSSAMWMIIAGVLVFFMQAGFAMLESGSVRAKNTKSILMKNLIDASVAAVGWTLLGYYIAFPPAKNNEQTQIFMTDKALQGQEKDFFFQFTFNATAATIVSGALAERTKIEGYIMFTMVMTVLIYPMIVSFTWGYGFLYDAGYNDFAGSGIVHMTGGVSALAAAICVGPRIGRFDGTADAAEFLPSNFGAVCLGTLILWVGWYGFNAGSTLGMHTEADGTEGQYTTAMNAGRCCITTTLGAASGGVVGFVVGTLMNKHYDVMSYCNGILAGLVGVTAGTGTLDTWGAMMGGAGGGLCYMIAAKLLEALKVDDPIGAFGVHGLAGAWGVIAHGLFSMDVGALMGGGGDLLGANLLGVGVIAGCSFGASMVLFLTLRVIGLLRASPEVEESGCDAECQPKLGDANMATEEPKPAAAPAAPMETSSSSQSSSEESA